ncbi:MAG: DUF4492 domain-containing protein [Bacteroidales bacterium]|nr:DUF4492 domain-containing protein [Bacteroidales bacterium]
MKATLQKIWNFYYDGFRSMTLGRTLWVIILIKLFVMFVVLRIFFFQPAMAEFETEEQKADNIIEQLTR